MFQISNQWMLFLLDVSTKALLLAVIAGIALKLLRLRDSNVRHRVWSSVLAGMLLLPLLALVLPAIPLSIPAGWANFGSTVEQVPLEAPTLASLVPPPPRANWPIWSVGFWRNNPSAARPVSARC